MRFPYLYRVFVADERVGVIDARHTTHALDRAKRVHRSPAVRVEPAEHDAPGFDGLDDLRDMLRASAVKAGAR